jgi:selenocysteine lyase/cysteine desulfurase
VVQRRHRRRRERAGRHGRAAIRPRGLRGRTVDYLGIPAVEIGLRHLEKVGIDAITERVTSLGSRLLEALQRARALRREPRDPLYGPATWDRRGGTIAFNFLHPDGAWSTSAFVDRAAAAHNISLRTGCFCNPGAGEVAFSISKERLEARFEEGMILDDYLGLVGMPTGGAVRVSLGIATNFADMQRFMEFATEFVDLTDVPSDLLPPRLAC